MRNTKDYELQYEGFHGLPGVCRIRLYEQPDHPPVVVCTEDPTKPQTSITNVAERIVMLVHEREQLPSHFLWVEHYLGKRFPDSYGPTPDPIYSLVSFEYDGKHFRNPRWQQSSKAQVEYLIGHSFEE